MSRVTEGIFEYPKTSHKMGEKWPEKSKFHARTAQNAAGLSRNADFDLIG
jgi:hypothetical protein